ncbi:hypothetical protein NKH57_03045 [Mesorhizobium sp. M1050]
MPTTDQAKICGDRAPRVWELQRLDLSGTSAFVERQMKMRASIVEGAIVVGSTNDDDIVIFKIENPTFVGLKLVFGKSANPPPAALTDGFAKPLGIQLGVNFGLQPDDFEQACALAGTAKAHPDEVADFHLFGDLVAEGLGYQQARTGIFIGGLDPAGQIYNVADGRETFVASKTQCADDGFAVVEADTNIEIDAIHRGKERLQTIDCGEGLKCGVHGAERSVWLVVDTEYCHEPIADQFVDETAILLDDVAGLGEVAIEQIHHVIGGKPLRQRCEIYNVAEEDRNTPCFTATRRGRSTKLAGDHHVGFV